MSGKKQSRIVSVRLHPRKEHEGEALRIIDEKLDEGYTLKQILVDAVLHAAGRTPEMFSQEDRINNTMANLQDKLESIDHLEVGVNALQQLERRFQEMLESSIASLLKQIKRDDPANLRKFAESEDDDDLDLPSDFIKNAQRSARKTYKQSHPRSSNDE
jgi:hypothetical protein